MSIDLIYKKKIKADDYISILIVVNYGLFALFFHMEMLISIIVYPFTALASVGVIKIITYLNKKSRIEKVRLNLFLGIVAIVISILFLWFFLMQPNFTTQVLMNLIAFPILIVGCAGIVKGSLLDIYARKHRVISIIIGIVTIFLCFSIFLNLFNSLIYSIVVLSVILFISILSRAALYLSEFGLSIKHKNIVTMPIMIDITLCFLA
jgi:uncharacterized membrane protein HdeD (DUF308 family)